MNAVACVWMRLLQRRYLPEKLNFRGLRNWYQPWIMLTSWSREEFITWDQGQVLLRGILGGRYVHAEVWPNGSKADWYE